MAITNTPNEVVHQAYKSDKRSWFALKHTHLSSYQPGYEHPDLVLPITGNTTVKLNMSRYLQSAPTVTPLFDSMRVNFRVFFAPQRLYTRGLYGNNFEEIDSIEEIPLPTSVIDATASFEGGEVFVISRGSLLNRLGYPASIIAGGKVLPIDALHNRNSYNAAGLRAVDSTYNWNLTPIVAYFDIWNHYIRNPYLDDVPITRHVSFEADGEVVGLVDPDYTLVPAQSLVNAVTAVRGVFTEVFDSVEPQSFYILGGYQIGDGLSSFAGVVPLFDSALFSGSPDSITSSDLLARNFGSYVTPTGMMPTNFGEHYQTMFYSEDDINKLQSIVIETDDSGNPTVEGLRLGRSVWNRTLRTILRGRKYTDWIDVQFGSKLKISDHPIFVGSDSMIVSFQDILNQSAQGGVPLGKAAGAGARGGKNADSERTIVFTAQEPGYLMVLVDFVPEVSYTDVLPRWVEYETMSSFPMPAYSGMQWQDLKSSDLVFSNETVNDNVIGKQPIYFDYMSSYNRTSGLFACQRVFNFEDNTIGEGFRSYTFQRNFDSIGQSSDAYISQVFGTYILSNTFDPQFADVGQNGRQNFWMKTEYNIRLFQPLEKQVVSGRI